MIGASKILTVSYGTFSCTLEGFEDPFSTMRQIAEYFRDLAADDRYFGCEPPVPDAAMLQQIAERSQRRRVSAEMQEHGLVLRAERGDTPESAGQPEVARAPVTEAQPEPESAVSRGSVVPLARPGLAAAGGDGLGSVSDKLLRLRAAAEQPEQTAPEDIESAFVEAGVTEEVAEDVAGSGDVAESVLPVASEETGGDAVEQMVADAASDAEEAEDLADSDALIASLAEPAFEEVPQAEVVPEAKDDGTAEDAEMPEVEATDMAEPEVAAVEVPDWLSGYQPEAEEPALAQAADEAEHPRAGHPAEGAEDEAVAEMATPSEAEDTPPSDVQAEEAEEESADAPEILSEAEGAPGDEPAEAETDERVVGRAERMAQRARARLARMVAWKSVEEPQEPTVEEAEAAVDTAESEMAAGRAEDETAVDLTELEVSTASDEAEAAAEAPVAEAPEAEAPEAEIEIPEVSAETGGFAEPAEAMAPAEETALSHEDEAELQAELAALRHDVGSAEADLAAALDISQPYGADDDVPEGTEVEDVAAAELPDDEETETESEEDEAPARSDRPRFAPVDQVKEQTSLQRLMETADSKLQGSDTMRKLNAFQQLKAAVAATFADRQASEEASAASQSGASDPYRADLREATRPRRPQLSEGAGASRRPEAPRPAAPPLVLVSEQRIDRPEPKRPADAGGIRPRRVLRENLPEEDRRIAGQTPEDGDSFRDFAERIGAVALSDLLEAAAAYTAHVEGRTRFSRAQVMSKIARLKASDSDGFSREEGLRSFGKLLRTGRIRRVQDGQFVISEESRFVQEARTGTD